MPVSKKKRNKKYSPPKGKATATGEGTGLSGDWLIKYQSFCFNSAMLKNGKHTKKIHIVFNKLLATYLRDCQEKQYLPSKDVMEEQAEVIFEIAEKQVFITDIDPRRMDSEFIEESIKESKIESQVNSNEVKKYLTVYNILDTSKLSMDETNFVIEYFKGAFNKDYDSVTIKTLTKIVRGYPSKHEMERIKSILIDNLNYITYKEMVKRGLAHHRSYSVIEKVRLWFKVRSI